MDLFLQIGHGMMSLSKDLIAKWGTGTVILSPRDLTEKQAVSFSDEIIKKKEKLYLILNIIILMQIIKINRVETLV